MKNNSVSSQLENLNRLQQNGIRVANAFLEAVTSSKENVPVNIIAEDGNETQVVIPSNSYLSAELARLRQSLLNISGLTRDKSNTIVNIDDNSEFREVFVNSYNRTYDKVLRSELSVNNRIRTEANALVERLMSPLTSIEIELPVRFINASKLRFTKFVLNNVDDIDEFSNGESYSNVIQKLSNKSYKTVNEIVNVENRQNRYYGDFDVTAVVDNDDNTYTISLNKLTYSDIRNVVEDSRELQIGDMITTSDGLSKLNILSVDNRNNTIRVAYLGGYQPIQIGTNSIKYLYNDNSEKRIVKVPIKFNEKSILFLSVVNPHTQVETVYGESILINSNDFIVIDGNTEYTFDTYFGARVANLGQYFESVIRENNIPVTLGVVPDKPQISVSDFKVVQINQHVTNTPAAEALKRLNTEKHTTYNNINIVNDKIRRLNLQIAKGNFKSSNERQLVEADLNNAIDEKNRLSALYQSIVSDITTALEGDIVIAEPKYRIRGFWPIQDDIQSPFTQPQKIVQYNVRYRYVSNSSDVTSGQSITFTGTNGDEITGLFSSWNEIKTKPLQKVMNDQGILVWENNLVEDANQTNVNQLDIPINYGESVEIQVQAISESGYPISPLLSPWSNIVRIEFPEELLIKTDVQSIASSNNNDKINVAVQREFSSQGITKHLETVVTEQDKYFAHDAKQIASGFLTAEQKIVSLFDKLIEYQRMINSLQELVDRRVSSITVELLDADGRVYNVNNNSSINLFAGYYTDNVDLASSNNFGEIVEKQFYIRLTNKNANDVEVLSLSPGGLHDVTDNVFYRNVPISYFGSEDESEQQLNGQILYVRNRNIPNSQDFFVSSDEESATIVPEGDQNTSAVQAAKNIVQNANGTVSTLALKRDASLEGYVVMTNMHPAYVQYVNDTSKLPILLDEFERLRTFNSIVRSDIVQNEFAEDRLTEFVDQDKYLVGANSVGARMFMRLNDISNVQVNGVDTTSSKQIKSGDTNAILIPLIFQYRMSDADGFIGGDSSLTQNTNFTYRKSVGIDLLVGNQPFKFDVTISAKFRPTAVSNNNLGISTVSQSIDSTSSINPQTT